MYQKLNFALLSAPCGENGLESKIGTLPTSRTLGKDTRIIVFPYPPSESFRPSLPSPPAAIYVAQPGMNKSMLLLSHICVYVSMCMLSLKDICVYMSTCMLLLSDY